METEKEKGNTGLIFAIYLLLIVGIILIIIQLSTIARGQEITEDQAQQIENQQEIFGVIDPNRKQINKNIKTKDMDLAEDLSFIYGKLEYLQKVCEK